MIHFHKEKLFLSQASKLGWFKGDSSGRDQIQKFFCFNFLCLYFIKSLSKPWIKPTGFEWNCMTDIDFNNNR